MHGPININFKFSSPRSQKPTTCPYPTLDLLCSRYITIFLTVIFILPSKLKSPKCSPTFRFPPKPLRTSPPVCYVPRVPHFSSFLSLILIFAFRLSTHKATFTLHVCNVSFTSAATSRIHCTRTIPNIKQKLPYKIRYISM
jgi:hypothetical protein